MPASHLVACGVLTKSPLRLVQSVPSSLSLQKYFKISFSSLTHISWLDTQLSKSPSRFGLKKKKSCLSHCKSSPCVMYNTLIASLQLSIRLHSASLMAQTGKNLPGMQETWVLSLCWQDLLEKGMASHSSILAWRSLWAEEPGGATVHGVTKSRTRLRRSGHTEPLITAISLFCFN